MLQILIDNPLLTFCIVAALGYLLGQIKIGGSSLGIAAVLFAGLFVGAIDPQYAFTHIKNQAPRTTGRKSVLGSPKGHPVLGSRRGMYLK
jgi:hypothetical protein